jgi:ribonucleoside-diphosphate reductase beta chain
MSVTLKRKQIYNPLTTEKINEAFVAGGSPSGIINFTKPTNKWSLNLWEQMLKNTWFPQETDMNPDKRAYPLLSNDEHRMYDLALAQLIFNDSEQTNNLADNINPYVTDPVINSCLARQTFEEALHSQTYAVMVEDISPNTDLIYELHRSDPVLAKKNAFISNMYASLASDSPTLETFALACVANNILEGIVFFGGFVAIWSLGDKMQGSASQVSFICRDEKTHLALFKNAHNTLLRQYPEIRSASLEDRAISMIREAAEIEIEWTKYITNGKILGFSDTAISWYVKDKANQISSNLGYGIIFEDVGKSPLVALEKKYEDPNNTRTNFFEGTVKNYSKGSLNMDDF